MSDNQARVSVRILEKEYHITCPIEERSDLLDSAEYLNMKMREIQEAASLIQEQAHEDANIIFGASIDETMGEAIKVTVIATGFGQAEVEVPAEAAQMSRRPASRGSVVQESFAPPTRSSVPARQEAPVYAAARKHTHTAAGSHMASGPAIRDRIVFPSGEVDLDWDTPAYQRRQGG